MRPYKFLFWGVIITTALGFLIAASGKPVSGIESLQAQNPTAAAALTVPTDVPTKEAKVSQQPTSTPKPTAIPTNTPFPTYTPIPTQVYVPPAQPVQQTCSGATAMCSDGSCSYSASRRGTCSHHGGVSVWY